MSEYASKALTCSYLSRTDLFDACNTRDDCQEKHRQIVEGAKNTKTLAAALRKCVREVTSMIKVANHGQGEWNCVLLFLKRALG